MEKQDFPFIQNQSSHPTYGKVAELLLPSRNTVTIREQTGNDDDVISSQGDSGDMSGPLNKFVASLIIKHSYDFPKNENTITANEVLNIPLRDKYFILMASRIFSISPTIKFTWDWRDARQPVHYEEDLVQYLPDFSQENLPEPGDPDYFKYRVEPYTSQEAFRELTLGSGKNVRYKWLDGHGENYMLNLTDGQRSINTPLKARFIELKLEDGNWVKITDFGSFKPIEMSEIRADIEKWDKSFDGLTDIQNPYTKEVISIPLLSIPDFFFPRQI